MSLTPQERSLLPATLVDLADRDPGKWLAAAKDHARQLSGNAGQLQPLHRKALNFLRSAWVHLRAGLPKAPVILQDRRLAICEQCPKFQVDGSRCGICGCAMRLKAAWENEKCPEGKW